MSKVSKKMRFTSDARYQNVVVRKSRSLLGYFTYATNDKREDWGNIFQPKKNGHADCSSFVWLVMKQCGADVGEHAFSTPEMEADAKVTHHFLRQVKAREVRAGDVVIVNVGEGYGGNGHTAVIDSPYRGRKTQIIEIGGIKPDGPVHRSQIGASFKSLLKKGRITYARPISVK